ncbi:hypothetical protein DICPUDRAFT_152231 [Dictyostelium purpureum]|uniref:Nucleotide-diphospho-sugar transferase domain-containing protein n=1 Tax=Dictyostelium purpureum TaxID=5786 RepID=F0ZKT6_DICPU|nr:uncharacterized protein DICPUDRAFT_152231 [Dictyostelium purpureum]EGC35435.1 hypothetical protein DICPUDRAFT_152231 [Dictyostelium purpureum]|eukprot:XP_003288048.1 hypothetical protein DICPUDRAFT_152231 [Dictyostelium purpureum]
MEPSSYIKKNDKIVLMCNYGFRDMTINLLNCFEKLNISRDRFLLYAIDDKSHQFFKSKGIESIRFSRDETNKKINTEFFDNEGVYGEEAESYGNIGFRAICNEKPLVVLEVLKQGYNVLWTDTDIVWQKDPFIHFYNEINKSNGFENNDDIDLYVQQDDDDICAGFYFIRSNPKTIKYIHDTIAFLNPMIDDQIAMRLFLKSQGVNILSKEILLKNQNSDKIKYVLLDRKLFPNGTAYFNLKLTQRANITPYIVHNNCIIGHRSKKERFIEYGLWSVDEKSLDISNNDNISNNEKTLISPKHILKAHTDIITSISSSNNQLYTTSMDKSIKIWEINGNTQLFKVLKSKYIHRRGAIWSTFIDDIKETILTASHDKTVQIWNKNFESINTFSGHTGIINQMVVIPNSDYILTCSDDSTIRLFSTQDSSYKRVYLGHSSWVSSIAFNNNIIYSCSNDETIRLWDFKTGRCLNIIKPYQGWIRKIILNLNNLISAGNDGTIKIWQCNEQGYIINEEQFKEIYTNGNSSINDMVVHENILYCAFDNGSLKSYNLTTLQLEKDYLGHKPSSINCIHVSKSLNLLFTGGFDRQIKSWEL